MLHEVGRDWRGGRVSRAHRRSVRSPADGVAVISFDDFLFYVDDALEDGRDRQAIWVTSERTDALRSKAPIPRTRSSTIVWA